MTLQLHPTAKGERQQSGRRSLRNCVFPNACTLCHSAGSLPLYWEIVCVLLEDIVIVCVWLEDTVIVYVLLEDSGSLVTKLQLEEVLS